MPDWGVRRILVVLPLYGGSLPIGRYVARALAGLGHVVETFEAPFFYPTFQNLRALRVGPEAVDALENGFLQLVSQAVLAQVERFSPDLVLAMAQAPLSRQTLRRLARDGVPTAMWFVEDYAVFTYWQAFAPLYDFFFTIQKEPFLGRLAEVGQKQAYYLPLAAAPEIHRPVPLSAIERRTYGSDVSFVGAGYPNRRLAFRAFADMDFRIWGSDWDGEEILAAYVQRGGARIETEEVVKIFCATRVNLNLHSSVRPAVTVGEGDFVNPRTFEIAACGAFQVVDQRSLLPELFADHELAVVDHVDAMVEATRYFLAHEEERTAMAARARARVLAEHTYTQRMETLLAVVGAALGWQSAEPRPSFLEPDLAAEVAALARDLGLRDDASFEDVVAAVRVRKGVLSPAETAVLFLDEWRKQYSRKSAA
ncbi:MAG: spore maturation protein CgeB [Desulfomicrobiaceae bacterium]|nr:spore maturation protein CgeB [Desulfomicrobiaceae bacterium]